MPSAAKLGLQRPQPVLDVFTPRAGGEWLGAAGLGGQVGQHGVGQPPGVAGLPLPAMPCPGCGTEVVRRGRRGPPPRWCSQACRHRTRRRLAGLTHTVTDWADALDVSDARAELSALRARLAATRR
jgi:hypothetical protein